MCAYSDEVRVSKVLGGLG